MFRRLRIPWPQMVLLVLTIAGVVRLHVSLLAAALISVMWMFTLWLDWIRPDHSADPFVIAERPDLDLVIRTAMAAVIAQVEVPLVLVHGHTILVANAAAQSALGPHIIGQDARVALRHPAAVALLGKADGGSTTVRGLTGARSQWQLTRRRIGAENRGPQYWMIELRDRNAEADISRAHTDFVANASHELRTPLSSIIGYVETLAEAPGQFDAATTEHFLATVLREARRMQSLVSDLMSLSQLEAEKHDAPTDRIAITPLVARVLSEFAYGDSGPRVTLCAPDQAIEVTGDTKQLEQLLRNLIDNALKYGDPESDDVQKPVEVCIAPEQRGYALLTITDHGAGIAADHLPHLTRRFYRADPGRSRAAGGTGLGLAIVKHIVERHRGKLDIASTLGTGTTVSVRLPMTGQAQEMAS
ncbi:MAG: ATP-binding protein [Pseudomonadota bacterium]|nr:ATP-binding protein [Pseudomonadota bacterium]